MRKKGTTGPESLTSQLLEAGINQASYEFGIGLLGYEGLLIPRG